MFRIEERNKTKITQLTVVIQIQQIVGFIISLKIQS